MARPCCAMLRFMLGRGRRRERQARRRRRLGIGVGVVSTLAEAGVLWVRTGRVGGRLAVRCRGGHVYTTIWVPGVSVKSLRLGWWRLQRCPVGRHWSLVTPLRESALSEDERRLAQRHHDIGIP